MLKYFRYLMLDINSPFRLECHGQTHSFYREWYGQRTQFVARTHTGTHPSEHRASDRLGYPGEPRRWIQTAIIPIMILATVLMLGHVGRAYVASWQTSKTQTESKAQTQSPQRSWLRAKWSMQQVVNDGFLVLFFVCVFGIASV